MKTKMTFPLCLTVLIAAGPTASAIGLHEIDLSAMTAGTGRGTAIPNRSVTNGPLSIAGEQFRHGVGTRAFSTLILELDGRAENLSGKAGADDAGKAGTVRFHVLGDRRVLRDGRVMRPGDRARTFSINLDGVRVLAFLVTNAGDGNRQDYADWVEVEMGYRGKAPAVAAWFNERPYLLTPPAPARTAQQRPPGPAGESRPRA